MTEAAQPLTPAKISTSTAAATPGGSTTPPLLVDAREAGRLCSVSRSLWLSLHGQGRVPRPVCLGRRMLWSIAELRSWIAAGCPPRDRWEASRVLEAGTRGSRRR